MIKIENLHIAEIPEKTASWRLAAGSWQFFLLVHHPLTLYPPIIPVLRETS
jgi:hypothetical protein